jgi:hypothetical protein
MTNSEMNEYTDRMDQGLSWLDENIPDWYRRVNTDTLDMAHCQNCVIGQMEPADWFSDSVNAVHAEARYEFISYDVDYTVYQWAEELGFDGVPGGYNDQVNEMWGQEIVNRKNANS